MEEVAFRAYLDRWFFRPGETITLMVDTDVAHFDASVGRLASGELPPGSGRLDFRSVSGLRREQLQGRRQPNRAGSSMVVDEGPSLTRGEALTILVWVWGRRLAMGHHQNLVSIHEPVGVSLVCLALDPAGRPQLRLGEQTFRLLAPLAARRWTLVAGGFDPERRVATIGVVEREEGLRAERAEADERPATADLARLGAGSRLVIGGAVGIFDDRADREGAFNGKLAGPVLLREHLPAASLRELARRTTAFSALARRAAGAWDFGRNIASRTVPDVTGHGAGGSLRNLVVRAVTGPHFDGCSPVWKLGETGHDAAYFSEDSLEDASFDADATFELPEGLRSGVYAVSLSAEGALPAYVPFFVGSRERKSRVAVLLPTITYLAYGNDHSGRESERSDDPLGLERCAPYRTELSPEERYLSDHEGLGLSAYDCHLDGEGCRLVSRLRPLLTMSPTYRWWMTGSHRNFSADLHMIGLLEHAGVEYDVLTDHELHAGRASLAPYEVLITGSHPEYASGNLRQAVESHVLAGGHLMYLGGNGFYAVASVPSWSEDVLEIRRSPGGTRPHDPLPGESHHASTGEPGGLWVHRGRPPQSLLGVGFTAQGWGRAPGYKLAGSEQAPAEVRRVLERAGLAGRRGGAVIGSSGSVSAGPPVTRSTGRTRSSGRRREHLSSRRAPAPTGPSTCLRSRSSTSPSHQCRAESPTRGSVRTSHGTDAPPEGSSFPSAR